MQADTWHSNRPYLPDAASKALTRDLTVLLCSTEQAGSLSADIRAVNLLVRAVYVVASGRTCGVA